MPTTAGVSKYFARGNRIVFAGWGFGSVFRDLHRELQSTHCPATGKTQNPLRATACGFDPHHRHHVGMDCAPFTTPSQLAGRFSYRFVIPPSPHKTLLRKFSWGAPPCGPRRKASIHSIPPTHIGMDCAPFTTPGQSAGRFLYSRQHSAKQAKAVSHILRDSQAFCGKILHFSLNFYKIQPNYR